MRRSTIWRTCILEVIKRTLLRNLSFNDENVRSLRRYACRISCKSCPDSSPPSESCCHTRKICVRCDSESRMQESISMLSRPFDPLLPHGRIWVSDSTSQIHTIINYKWQPVCDANSLADTGSKPQAPYNTCRRPNGLWSAIRHRRRVLDA